MRSIGKKRNGIIDIYRVIAAVLIVLTHYNGGVIGLRYLSESLGRIGVPIFFMITGYFFFSKIQYHSCIDNYNKLRVVLVCNI